LECDIELLFIGNIDPGYEKIITGSNFRNSVRILGQKPHAEAISAMCNADVLLVLQGGDKMKDTEVPGKIFEYMGSGRYILALVKPGDVSAILSKTNTALIVNPDDTDVIKKQLLDLIELKKQGRLIPYPNNEYIHTFSRKVLTGKLGDLLDKTVSRSS
jgi:glycosyltransferase involved in cell wall biosynthesis